MASHNYLIDKEKNHIGKRVNVVNLINDAKILKKKKKRKNIIVAAATLFILAVSGFVISL